jgi:hypothetical protein
VSLKGEDSERAYQPFALCTYQYRASTSLCLQNIVLSNINTPLMFSGISVMKTLNKRVGVKDNDPLCAVNGFERSEGAGTTSWQPLFSLSLWLLCFFTRTVHSARSHHLQFAVYITI